LNVIEAFTSMTGQQITVSLVQSLIGELADVQEERPISIADIERVVADRYKLKGALLRSQKRTKEIAHARHVAMYLARTLPMRRYRRSAEGRDHTSVCMPLTKSKGWLRTTGASRRKSSSSSDAPG
jgi:chromosomal replication initiator protein